MVCSVLVLTGVDGRAVNVIVDRSTQELEAIVVTECSPLRVNNHLCEHTDNKCTK